MSRCGLSRLNPFSILSRSSSSLIPGPYGCGASVLSSPLRAPKVCINPRMVDMTSAKKLRGIPGRFCMCPAWFSSVYLGVSDLPYQWTSDNKNNVTRVVMGRLVLSRECSKMSFAIVLKVCVWRGRGLGWQEGRRGGGLLSSGSKKLPLAFLVTVSENLRPPPH